MDRGTKELRKGEMMGQTYKKNRKTMREKEESCTAPRVMRQ
jgi:hypothetical protein